MKEVSDRGERTRGENPTRTGEGVLGPETARRELQAGQKSRIEEKRERRRVNSLRDQRRLPENGEQNGEVERRSPDPMPTISTVRSEETSPEDEK